MPAASIINPGQDSQQFVSTLKKSRLFNNFPDDVLHQISPFFKQCQFPKAQEIIREGETDNTIYFLIKGKVSVYSKGELLLQLRRLGDMCGGMSVITNKPSLSTEIAETDVEAVCMNLDEYTDDSGMRSEEIHNLLFRLYTIILIDKLALTTNKVCQTGAADKKLFESQKKLEEALAEASKAYRVRSCFLDNINHELRTPMHGVIGMTSLLMETELTDQQKEYSRLIQTSAKSLMKVINNILNYSKLETGQILLNAKEFPVERLPDKIRDTLRPSAQEKNLDFQVAVEPDLPQHLIGDFQRIYQVLENLVENAVKFTQQGQIIVRLERESETPDTAVLRFSVSDTGIGIPAEFRESLFDAFMQVDDSLTRNFPGTGLGLAICRRLIELMQGKIGVISREDEGSTFWFTLSLKKPTRTTSEVEPLLSVFEFDASEIPSAPPTPVEKIVSVLLVEPDKVQQLAISLLMKKLGHQVSPVDSCDKAIKVLELLPFDVLILNLNLTDLDGFNTAEQIRRNGIATLNPQIPIIGLIPTAEECDIQKCQDLGINEVLDKPLTFDKLKAVMNRWTDTLHPPDTVRVSFEPLSPPAIAAVDQEALNTLKGTIGCIGPLIHQFIADLPKKLKAIQLSIDQANCDDLRKSAHVLKINCSIFGASQATYHCEQLENTASLGEISNSLDWFTALKSECHQVVAALKYELQKAN